MNSMIVGSFAEPSLSTRHERVRAVADAKSLHSPCRAISGRIGAPPISNITRPGATLVHTVH